MQKSFVSYFLLILTLAVVGCAKRGNITGGLKDSLAPVLRSSSPKNGATNFSGKEIKLYFDEYVKMKNVSKQLIISPLMKNKPDVLPYNASKFITIKLNDTLQPNTTYSLNFGQSIEDNNEGNILNQFKYVFSTGSYIDSLTLGVKLKDAIDLKTDTSVSVMLYEINEKFNDSTIYKEVPRYLVNTLENGNAIKLENIKEGKYQLIALKDANSNNKFDPKADKIGFMKEIVSIPTDTIFQLELFKEELPFRSLKPGQASGNRMVVGYQGNPKDVKIEVKKGEIPVSFKVTQLSKKDSLQIWFPPIKNDSLAVTLSKKDFSSNYSVKIKDQKKDTLSITSSSGGELPFRKKFRLIASTPLTAIDASKITLFNKDSVKVAFTTQYDEWNQEVVFDFEKQPLEKYKLIVLPDALTDFYEKKNDTLIYTFSTRNTSDYGNLRIGLERVQRYPLIVEITDEKGTVMEREIVEKETKVFFDLIEPKKYMLRVIYDDNKNGVWDAGNYIEKRQSEEVIYFAKEIDVRANWDVEQPFDIGTK